MKNEILYYCRAKHKKCTTPLQRLLYGVICIILIKEKHCFLYFYLKTALVNYEYPCFNHYPTKWSVVMPFQLQQNLTFLFCYSMHYMRTITTNMCVHARVFVCERVRLCVCVLNQYAVSEWSSYLVCKTTKASTNKTNTH